MKSTLLALCMVLLAASPALADRSELAFHAATGCMKGLAYALILAAVALVVKLARALLKKAGKSLDL